MKGQHTLFSPAAQAPSAAYRIVPLAAVDEGFTYLSAEPLQRGEICRIPLGKKQTHGVVWGDEPAPSGDIRLKAISGRVDLPPLPAETLDFLDWAGRYTLLPRGLLMKMAVPVEEALKPEMTETVYALNSRAPETRLTAARTHLKEVLAAHPWQSLGDLRRHGITAAVVRGFEKAGGLITRQQAVEFHFPAPFPRPMAFPPTSEQADAIAILRKRLETGAYGPVLLEGVTGAGKTEVYFEAIADVLKNKGQALILLPEIALSQQWLERFKARFGVIPALWHSEMGAARRRQTWRAILKGQCQVIVGARSALFLPYPNLQLIVVDEEHDGSFKQEDGGAYQARDMAVARAQLAKLPVILASATPSVESLYNVREGKYAHLQLRQRATGARLPETHLVDLRQQKLPAGQWISAALADQIHKTLDRGEQALLFLNRRGYSPLQLCTACGLRLECPDCTSWLVEHRFRGHLLCHQCGHQEELPESCPACGGVESFRALGPGVERIEEEAQQKFPGIRIATLSSDTLDSPRKRGQLFADIEARRIPLLIGTQLMAKGHHFPHLTCIGVIDADMAGAGPDFRAAERTFQLLQQVAGRAGREDKPGHVWLQTYQPEAPVLQALQHQDADAFIRREFEMREMLGWPPFGRLAALILSGKNESQVKESAQRLAFQAPRHERIQVLGPAPAPMYRLRGKYRWRLLLKTDRQTHIQKVLIGWTSQLSLPSAVTLHIDIDPYSFM